MSLPSEKKEQSLGWCCSMNSVELDCPPNATIAPPHLKLIFAKPIDRGAVMPFFSVTMRLVEVPSFSVTSSQRLKRNFL
jgi:hypothetical protein